MGRDELIARAVEAMREDPFMDDIYALGTTAQDDRMTHYATVAHGAFGCRRVSAAERPSLVIDAKVLGEVMQDAWGEICDDAQAHPDDIRREGRKLFYQPRQWTDLVAIRFNDRLVAATTLAAGADQPATTDIDYEVWQENAFGDGDGVVAVSSSEPEAWHYPAVYSQDAPAWVVEVSRRRLSHAE